MLVIDSAYTVGVSFLTKDQIQNSKHKIQSHKLHFIHKPIKDNIKYIEVCLLGYRCELL